MSTSLALASAANAQAALAQQQADRAAKMACEAMMPAYTHQGATVDQMRGYAECVSRLYPLPTSGSELIILKVAVALLFVAVIIGAWRSWDSYDGPLMGAFGAFIAVLCAEFALFLVVAGLAFLFS